MSKRVGIITFQNANNYGAVLQAFALQTAFENVGHEVSIINYDSCEMGLKAVQSPIFSDFVSEYLNLTDEYIDKNEIKYNEFDLLVTGSDQVWNPEITNGDTAYFLDFADDSVKKASYAASIGIVGAELEKYHSYYSSNLAGFSNVSIREQSQSKFISDILGREISVNIDPTLLLEASEYEKHFNITTYGVGYIFMYSNNRDPKMIDFVNLLSLYTGMKVVTVSNNEDAAFTSGSTSFMCVNPKEWMTAIANAKIVITDSFHGLMMSLIFEKPFYMYTKKRSNISRITEILEKCNLQERTLNCLSSVKDVNYDIDFSAKREYVNVERQKSMEYIKRLI